MIEEDFAALCRAVSEQMGPLELPTRWTFLLCLDNPLAAEIMAEHRSLLVLQCERCEGWTDTLKWGKCLSCGSRPWQNGSYRSGEEVLAWKP